MNNSLLINDKHRRTFNEELAYLIGLNEAIFLQQIFYWLRINTEAGKNYHKKKYWVYNSYVQWQQGNFRFWSESTIKRTIKNLEDLGLLITDKFNKVKYDKTKWYTIDYKKLDKIEKDYKKSNPKVKLTKGLPRGQNDPIEETNLNKRKSQDDPIDETNLSQPIPDISSKNTPENKKESNQSFCNKDQKNEKKKRSSNKSVQIVQTFETEESTGKKESKGQNKIDAARGATGITEDVAIENTSKPFNPADEPEPKNKKNGKKTNIRVRKSNVASGWTPETEKIFCQVLDTFMERPADDRIFFKMEDRSQVALNVALHLIETKQEPVGYTNWYLDNEEKCKRLGWAYFSSKGIMGEYNAYAKKNGKSQKKSLSIAEQRARIKEHLAKAKA